MRDRSSRLILYEKPPPSPGSSCMRQDYLMTDAAASDIIEVLDALSGHKFTDCLVRGGGLFGFGRHAMVEYDDDLRRVPHAAHADFEKALADQIGIFVAHGEVHTRDHDLLRRHAIIPGSASENLFGQCHTHGSSSPITGRLQPATAGTRAPWPGIPAAPRKPCSP